MARRTKEEALETRNALLDAAEREFSRRGVGGTTLGDIAKAAGVTRGALYHHFLDKRDLVEAMTERALSPAREMRLRNVANGEPFIPQIRASFRKFLQLVVNDPRIRDTFTIIYLKCEAVEANAAIREYHQNEFNICITEMAADAGHAIARGELPSHLKPKQVAMALFALMDGLLLNWLDTTDGFDLVEDGMVALDALLTGLATPRVASAVGTSSVAGAMTAA